MLIYCWLPLGVCTCIVFLFYVTHHAQFATTTLQRDVSFFALLQACTAKKCRWLCFRMTTNIAVSDTVTSRCIPKRKRTLRSATLGHLTLRHSEGGEGLSRFRFHHVIAVRFGEPRVFLAANCNFSGRASVENQHITFEHILHDHTPTQLNSIERY